MRDASEIQAFTADPASLPRPYFACRGRPPISGSVKRRNCIESDVCYCTYSSVIVVCMHPNGMLNVSVKIVLVHL